MRDVELNPHTILQAIEEHLHMMPAFAGGTCASRRRPSWSSSWRCITRSRSGRQTVEAADLFSAVFEETQGVPVSILRRHGVEPEALVSRLATGCATRSCARSG